LSVGDRCKEMVAQTFLSVGDPARIGGTDILVCG
jgi:hypothetical protein